MGIHEAGARSGPGPSAARSRARRRARAAASGAAPRRPGLRAGHRPGAHADASAGAAADADSAAGSRPGPARADAAARPGPMAGPAPGPAPPAPASGADAARARAGSRAPAYFGDEAPIEGEPAGFWIRFLAYMIDSVIIGLLMGVIWAPTMFLTMRSATSGGPGPLATILPFLSFLLDDGRRPRLHPLVLGNPGRDPRQEDARPEDRPGGRRGAARLGTAFMRLVGYMVSGFILYIGFFMIAFNPEKKGLHDMIAKTRVLKVR